MTYLSFVPLPRKPRQQNYPFQCVTVPVEFGHAHDQSHHLKYGDYQQFSVPLGPDVELGSQPEFYKSAELVTALHHLPVLIQRLWVMKRRRFHPIAVSWRQTQHILTTAVVPEQIGAILQTNVVDPIETMVSEAWRLGALSDRFYSRWSEHRQRNELSSKFAIHSCGPQLFQNAAVDLTGYGRVIGPDPDAFYLTHVGAASPHVSQAQALTYITDLTYSNLDPTFIPGVHNEPPRALEIDPSVTTFGGVRYNCAAPYFEQIQVTDLFCTIRWSPVGMSVESFGTVDRFHSWCPGVAFSPEPLIEIASRILTEMMRDTAINADKVDVLKREINQNGDVTVTILMTYGHEALVGVYVRQSLVHQVYYDLALMTLMSLSVSPPGAVA